MSFFFKNITFFLFFLSFIWAQNDANILEEQDLDFISYKPIYFGRTSSYTNPVEQGEVKFQLSFKYELFDKSDIFMGFTQKAFWSIQKPSQPFREINFAPEIFYTLKLWEHLHSVTFGIFKHESTGEDGYDSFGWNRSYIETTLLFEDLSFSIMFWGPAIGMSEYDATYSRVRLFQYYGYGELYIRYLSKFHNQHTFTVRKGTLDNVYGFMYQWDIDFDNIIQTSKDHDGWNMNLFIQFWQGYGESLKTYDIFSQRLTLGLSIVH